ncbi:hypothetical protein HYPDE_40253 [Hyphomicrobium denitrificans 1NES1]|uniref:Uncharacterized protein n=2 Tax=Hyphomicrobium denitrificans TaxID=53399 RepID=N0B7V8_9HYPH|nr:hypothetical protein HYPDE_40253 [Hyphomicrobium denitrificans 1NES1]
MSSSRMKVFRWKNCYADVAASKHGITVQSFFDDVIAPAICALEDKISALGRSGDPGDAFAQADMEDVLKETKMAFGLAIQSIWERQLRGYLRGCASELMPSNALAAQVTKANWTQLCELFLELRGIRLNAFPSFADLDTLQLLGNACRHGDGSSAIEVAMRCPELWRVYPPMPFEDQPRDSGLPPIALMDVPVERLREFVAAVAIFWDDAEYIYNESIERKHPSLEAKLARERTERNWRPQATPDGGA